MRRSGVGAALVGCALLGLMVACGSNETKAQLFAGDDFDSYAIGIWTTPSNGWQSLRDQTWSITSGGVTGNALYFAPNANDWLVHEFGPIDYTASVQIKHSLTPLQGSSYRATLIGRLTTVASHYEARLYTSDAHPQHTTWLALGKYWQEGATSYASGLQSVKFFDGDIDPTVYYKLTLQFQGNTLTATASAANIPLVSVSFTDDGVTNGPVLTGTLVGVRANAETNFHPSFDDFTMTVP